ncbi:MAG: hypothetical protein H6Q17_1952 [Bacteroidetes bacterium]|nr:hypothetical protein [Bacteroidota bacterium]
METQENELFENRRRTLADDPQYFGAYLNLARLNIFSINNYLAKEFQQTELRDDELIQNGFICIPSQKNRNDNKLFERLIRLMPVIKQFDAARLPNEEQKSGQAEGKDIKTMAKTLKALFKDMQEFRNDYTHFYATDKQECRKLTVSSETATFLKASFARAIEYSKVRFKDVLAEDDYSLVAGKELVEDENTITTEGLVFFTALFLDRENAFQFIGKVQGLKGTQFKSFIATREVLMAYCVRLPHDKLISDNPIQALLFDILNELNKCPKKLYNVLSEEVKKEFRPELSESGIENMLANSFNDEEREKLLDEIEYKEYIEQLTIRVRHSNRFHYFAMRFIDEQELWPGIRFQIDLGKYTLTQYDKQVLGESIPRSVVENTRAFGRLSNFLTADPDSLEQRIDVDHRANGFEQFAPHYNADINKIGIAFTEKEQLPYVVPTKNAETNRVKYSFKQPQPDAFISLHELAKAILLEQLQPGESEKLIRAFCSTAENKLFNLEFIESIKWKLPDWKPFQKQCDTKKSRAYITKKKMFAYAPRDRKKLLDELLAPYGLNWKQVPERILNYWLNIEEVHDARSIKERILLMKRDGLKRLKQLEKHRKDPSIRIPKVGEMATFLARDIVDMMIDKTKKQKITSIYYDKMQECLAFYADAEKKRQFIGLVRELNLNAPDGHPFLKNLNLESIRKTSEFYKLYLMEKVEKMIENGYKSNGDKRFKNIAWIIRVFEEKQKNEKNGKDDTIYRIPNNRNDIPYTIRQWEKETSTLEEWLHTINHGKQEGDRKRPIDLPTDLFDARLCELMKGQMQENGQTFADTAKYNELLKQWWSLREDETQPFYNGARHYVIKEEAVCFMPGAQPRLTSCYADAVEEAYNRLSAERNIARRHNKQLPLIQKQKVEKVFKHTLYDTEREIRLLGEQDRILLLMAEQLTPGRETLKLKTVSEELTRPREIKKEFPYISNYNAQGEKLPKDEPKPKIKVTVTGIMQLKNSNDLNRFAHDRRMPELVAYLPNATIDADTLRYELMDYNKARLTVFDAVFRLEKAIIDQDREGVITLFTDEQGEAKQGRMQHKPYLQWLLNKGIITQPESSYLNMLRNSFSHNQVPHIAVALNGTEVVPVKNIASTIAGAYKQKIETIIGKIG